MIDKIERSLFGTLSSPPTVIGTVSVGRDSDDSQVYILEDKNGVSVTAFLTDEIVELTAKANDIRAGTTAVTDDGVITGEKEIPSYNTREGRRIITKGSKVILPSPTHYNYTRLQAIICSYNTSMDNSVSAEMVAINDVLYNTFSSTPVTTIFKDSSNTRIDFGITNETNNDYVLRYFMYKEEY